jgi:2,3-bisphosphoglycerate-dependent phosphoglycerate mutase
VTSLAFETHSITTDNERGVATGWGSCGLSDAGRALAVELGVRRRNDSITVTFSSDLARAIDTARIALEGSAMPILQDWRLRECDYGGRTGMPVAELAATRSNHLTVGYPDGESWQDAIDRVGRFLDDVSWRYADHRVLVIGHTATRWGLDHHLIGIDLADLLDAEFNWQPGWEYTL